MPASRLSSSRCSARASSRAMSRATTRSAATASRRSARYQVMSDFDNNLIELADRSSGDGVHVQLLWRRGAGEVVLLVSDDRTGVSFGVDVPGDRAMDAFRHPFLYVGPVELGEPI